MIFILGVIIGILLSIVVMLSVRRFEQPIYRTKENVLNLFKENGEVYIEEDEKVELEHFLDNLPKE